MLSISIKYISQHPFDMFKLCKLSELSVFIGHFTQGMVGATMNLVLPYVVK